MGFFFFPTCFGGGAGAAKKTKKRLPPPATNHGGLRMTWVNWCAFRISVYFYIILVTFKTAINSFRICLTKINHFV